MPQQSISVSIEGDRTYVKALKALAYTRGVTIAKLVRSAIDKEYGHDLEPHLDFFVAQDGRKNVHLDTNTSKPAVRRSTKS